MTENELSKHIVNSAYKVHKELGPGLLESVYEHCLIYELNLLGIKTLQQHPLPVFYKEIKMDIGFRLDVWVENKVVVEIKAVEDFHDIHFAKVINYLKLAENKLGFLINFNVKFIKNGIRRVANGI